MFFSGFNPGSPSDNQFHRTLVTTYILEKRDEFKHLLKNNFNAGLLLNHLSFLGDEEEHARFKELQDPCLYIKDILDILKELNLVSDLFLNKSLEGVSSLNDRKLGQLPANIAGLLIEYGADINSSEGKSFLFDAAEWNGLETIRYLIEVVGIDMNITDSRSGESLVSFAIRNNGAHFDGWLENARLSLYLLERGATGYHYSDLEFLLYCVATEYEENAPESKKEEVKEFAKKLILHDKTLVGGAIELCENEECGAPNLLRLWAADLHGCDIKSATNGGLSPRSYN